jgi:hypothetical protein
VKKLVFLSVALLVIVWGGQAQIDSLKLERYHQKIDSLNKLTQLKFSTDSLKLESWSDSLRNRVQQKFNRDSLGVRNVGAPAQALQHKYDSLRQQQDKLLAEVESKKTELLTRHKEKLEGWRDKVQQGMGGHGINGNIPDVNTSTLRVGENISLPEMSSLNAAQLTNVNLSPDLAALNKTISFDGIERISAVTEKLNGFQDEVGALKNIGTNPDQALETTLSKVEEVGAIKEELGAVEQLKSNEAVEMAEKLKDPAALKEEVKEMVVEKAINHFEGKEQVLQDAMEKLSKYKQKYESLNSLSELKKRPPNPMKGKPLVERLLPGVGLQILSNNNLFLDINPYVGYKLSGRFTTGLGWNQRIGYSKDHHYFTSVSEVYGPRFFVEAKGWRGFCLRAEFEWMNTYVPPTIRKLNGDKAERQWVPTAFVGVKKEYRFIKNVRGTAFIMMRVFNSQHKSPYGDVVNSRFGLEFPMRKK